MTAVADAMRSQARGFLEAEPQADPEDDALPSAEPALFRAVMRHHAKGVAVITAGLQSPTGFCATSLVSVSLDPPLVAFTVGRHATSLATIQTARHVMVHLLTTGQEDIARRFAQPGGDKFGPRTHWHRGAFGLPVIDGVLAWMLLVPVSSLLAGDHVLVIGRVVLAGHVTDGEPLIHHNGDFARIAALEA